MVVANFPPRSPHGPTPAGGVCRTDLHVIDGDLQPRSHGIVPGHEVVGRVVALGPSATRFKLGERVGIPWLGGACCHCGYCAAHRENLCDTPVFTGCDRNGGFAEYALADERFCLALPDAYEDLHAAPLLCAGLTFMMSVNGTQDHESALIPAQEGIQNLVDSRLRGNDNPFGISH